MTGSGYSELSELSGLMEARTMSLPRVKSMKASGTEHVEGEEGDGSCPLGQAHLEQGSSSLHIILTFICATKV